MSTASLADTTCGNSGPPDTVVLIAHLVHPHDTLAGIAVRYGTTPADLCAVNRLPLNGTQLFVHSTIAVPVALSRVCTCGASHHNASSSLLSGSAPPIPPLLLLQQQHPRLSSAISGARFGCAADSGSHMSLPTTSSLALLPPPPSHDEPDLDSCCCPQCGSYSISSSSRAGLAVSPTSMHSSPTTADHDDDADNNANAVTGSVSGRLTAIDAELEQAMADWKRVTATESRVISPVADLRRPFRDVVVAATAPPAPTAAPLHYQSRSSSDSGGSSETYRHYVAARSTTPEAVLSKAAAWVGDVLGAAAAVSPAGLVSPSRWRSQSATPTSASPFRAVAAGLGIQELSEAVSPSSSKRSRGVTLEREFELHGFVAPRAPPRAAAVGVDPGLGTVARV